MDALILRAQDAQEQCAPLTKPGTQLNPERLKIFYAGVLQMFEKKSTDNAKDSKIPTESNLLDRLCEIAIERHFKKFLKTASKYDFTNESTDQLTVIICEALVKDLDNEIWQRIAPKMLDRVTKMKALAMEATGGHRRV